MRISSIQDDPGFAEFIKREPYSHHIAVFVNGESIRHPVTVDLNKGEVLCYSCDMDGKPIQVGTGYACAKLIGEVTIIIPNALPPELPQ